MNGAPTLLRYGQYEVSPARTLAVRLEDALSGGYTVERPYLADPWLRVMGRTHRVAWVCPAARVIWHDPADAPHEDPHAVHAALAAAAATLDYAFLFTQPTRTRATRLSAFGYAALLADAWRTYPERDMAAGAAAIRAAMGMDDLRARLRLGGPCEMLPWTLGTPAQFPAFWADMDNYESWAYEQAR